MKNEKLKYRGKNIINTKYIDDNPNKHMAICPECGSRLFLDMDIESNVSIRINLDGTTSKIQHISRMNQTERAYIECENYGICGIKYDLSKWIDGEWKRW